MWRLSLCSQNVLFSCHSWILCFEHKLIIIQRSFVHWSLIQMKLIGSYLSINRWLKYGRRREGRWTPIRAKAQDTRANPNSWETHLVRKRWDIGLLRALSLRIM